MTGALWARPAVAGDEALVGRITDAAYSEYVALLGAPPLPMTEDHGQRIAAGQVWVVSRGDVPAGVAVLEREAEALTVFSLAVLPEARGGVGRWMLAFAEAEARAAGLREVRLYTNARMARNIGIYEKAGFAETGRRPHEQRPGWTLVDMAKRV